MRLTLDSSKLQQRVALILQSIDQRELLQAVGNKQLRWIDQNFKNSGTERPWAPLRPATVARRRKGKGTEPDKPLLDTGQLRRSFVTQMEGDAILVGVVGPKAAQAKTGGVGNRTFSGGRVVSTSALTVADVAAIHQHGASHIPARPMLPSTRLAEKLAVEVIDAAFEVIVNGAR